MTYTDEQIKACIEETGLIPDSSKWSETYYYKRNLLWVQ